MRKREEINCHYIYTLLCKLEQKGDLIMIFSKLKLGVSIGIATVLLLTACMQNTVEESSVAIEQQVNSIQTNNEANNDKSKTSDTNTDEDLKSTKQSASTKSTTTKKTSKESTSTSTSVAETTSTTKASEVTTVAPSKKNSIVKLNSANGRAVAVMMDNHPNARQHAGHSQADMIFEFKVEGNYSRYLGVFYSKAPNYIGPIRSSRPYFIERMQEFDPLYVHVGGSNHALQILRNSNFKDVDAMFTSSATIWRDSSTGKNSPHNAYASFNSVNSFANYMGYANKSNFPSYSYNTVPQTLGGQIVSQVTVAMSSSQQNTFAFDSNSKKYNVYRNGVLAVDESSGQKVQVGNIIIQITAYSQDPVEPNVRAVQQVGQGTGYYYSNGEYLPLTWSKNSSGERTNYYVNGKEIVFNPGMIWVCVVPPNTAVNTK